ncbi:50S ribosomal protein L29 [Candidatus Uhrbacteria bacterium]|nr:50S ribosomal protein L29 [Candidatus Uhrbacteria bacterium]
MKVKELREKSDVEIEKMLVELREKVRDSRFRLAGREMARVREVRDNKKTIARLLTLKTQRRTAAAARTAKA